MLDMKRVSMFLAIIIIALGTAALTFPGVVKDVRLGLDLKGGFEVLYLASPLDEGAIVTQDTLRVAARNLRDRIDQFGIAEPDVTPEGSDRIRVKLAGVENQNEVRAILRRPADLRFEGPDGTIEMRGDDFPQNAARVEFDDLGTPMVAIEVKDASKFEDISRRLQGERMYIILDDEVISSPGFYSGVISGGRAQITGNFTLDEARELRDIINLGALPVSLEEVYIQSVDATLGQMSLETTVRAGVIGAILVLLYMMFFYRVPGVIASITIITYVWLILLTMTLANATLTLPGIAAFVLGIGMAVDANIITYERIREEIRAGKTMVSAMKSGSKNALSTIIDANVTTFLAAAVLYYVGTGPIQGFALILMLSIVASVLTNVFLSRYLMSLLVRSKLMKHAHLFGVKEGDIRDL